jgi:hypothetical protein
LDLSFDTLNDREFCRGFAHVRGCREGRFHSNRGDIPFRIIDGNTNGRYSDKSLTTRSGDTGLMDDMVIDFSGKGAFNDDNEQIRAWHLSGIPTFFGKPYRIHISPNGRTVSISAFGKQGG